ncbi:MAG TPA: hypothetical protein EYP85_05090 [Armatimonadetes bacterium]|nr:hypothetical protein [Armatimonadota bacterium]
MDKHAWENTEYPALQLTDLGGPVRIPQLVAKKVGPLVNSDVLVEVLRCNFCPTDDRIRTNEFRKGVPADLVPGHEIFGRVVWLGERVNELRAEKGLSSLKMGDYVIVDPNIFCEYFVGLDLTHYPDQVRAQAEAGKCYYCSQRREDCCQHLAAVGVNLDGGYAQYVKVPAYQPLSVEVTIPRNGKDEPAEETGKVWTQMSCAEPLACVRWGILQATPFGETAALCPSLAAPLLARAKEWAGEQSLLVIGGGFIGQLMLQAARREGFTIRLLSEPNPRRRELAQRKGWATQVVNPTGAKIDELRRRVKEALGGDLPGVVIECVGTVQAAEQAAALAGTKGRIIWFGVSPPPHRARVSPYELYERRGHIVGSGIYLDRDPENPQPHGMLQWAGERLQRGEVRADFGDLGPQVVDLKGMSAHLQTPRDRGEVLKLSVEPGTGLKPLTP